MFIAIWRLLLYVVPLRPPLLSARKLLNPGSWRRKPRTESNIRTQACLCFGRSNTCGIWMGWRPRAVFCHFIVLLGEGYTVQKGQIPCKSLQVMFLRAAPPGSIEAPLSAAKLFHTHAPQPLSRSWQPGGGPSQEGTSQHDKGGPTASDKRLGYLEGTWGTSAGTCDSCYRTVWRHPVPGINGC